MQSGGKNFQRKGAGKRRGYPQPRRMETRNRSRGERQSSPLVGVTRAESMPTLCSKNQATQRSFLLLSALVATASMAASSLILPVEGEQINPEYSRFPIPHERQEMEGSATAPLNQIVQSLFEVDHCQRKLEDLTAACRASTPLLPEVSDVYLQGGQLSAIVYPDRAAVSGNITWSIQVSPFSGKYMTIPLLSGYDPTGSFTPTKLEASLVQEERKKEKINALLPSDTQVSRTPLTVGQRPGEEPGLQDMVMYTSESGLVEVHLEFVAALQQQSNTVTRRQWKKIVNDNFSKMSVQEEDGDEERDPNKNRERMIVKTTTEDYLLVVPHVNVASLQVKEINFVNEEGEGSVEMLSTGVVGLTQSCVEWKTVPVRDEANREVDKNRVDGKKPVTEGGEEVCVNLSASAMAASLNKKSRKLGAKQGSDEMKLLSSSSGAEQLPDLYYEMAWKRERVIEMKDKLSEKVFGGDEYDEEEDDEDDNFDGNEDGDKHGQKQPSGLYSATERELLKYAQSGRYVRKGGAISTHNTVVSTHTHLKYGDGMQYMLMDVALSGLQSSSTSSPNAMILQNEETCARLEFRHDSLMITGVEGENIVSYNVLPPIYHDEEQGSKSIKTTLERKAGAESLNRYSSTRNPVIVCYSKPQSASTMQFRVMGETVLGNNDTATAPVLNCNDARKCAGWISVISEKNTEVIQKSLEGAQISRISVTDLPSDILRPSIMLGKPKQNEEKVIHAYRFHSAEYRIEFSVVSHKAAAVLQASVNLAELRVAVSAESGNALHRLSLDVSASSQQYLRLWLNGNSSSLHSSSPSSSSPSSSPIATLWSTVVNGEPVSPATAEDGAVLIPLITQNGNQQFQVEIDYVVKAIMNGNEKSYGSYIISVPAIAAPISTLFVRMNIPGGDYSYAFDTTMSSSSFTILRDAKERAKGKNSNFANIFSSGAAPDQPSATRGWELDERREEEVREKVFKMRNEEGVPSAELDELYMEELEFSHEEIEEDDFGQYRGEWEKEKKKKKKNKNRNEVYSRQQPRAVRTPSGSSSSSNLDVVGLPVQVLFQSSGEEHIFVADLVLFDNSNLLNVTVRYQSDSLNWLQRLFIYLFQRS